MFARIVDIALMLFFGGVAIVLVSFVVVAYVSEVVKDFTLPWSKRKP